MGLKYESNPRLSSKSCLVLEKFGIILQQELHNFIQEQFSIQVLLIEPLTLICLEYALDRLHASSWGYRSVSIFLLGAVLPYINCQKLQGVVYGVAGGIDVF